MLKEHSGNVGVFRVNRRLSNVHKIEVHIKSWTMPGVGVGALDNHTKAVSRTHPYPYSSMEEALGL